MMEAYSPVGIVNPTKPKPKLSTADQPGVTLPPPQGAGSTAPAPEAPPPLPGVTALPFGNGVTPVLKAEPTLNPLTGQYSTPGSPSTYATAEQALGTAKGPAAPMTGPVGDPMVTMPQMAPVEGNVQGTLIAPTPGSTDQSIDYWRKQFAGSLGTEPDLEAPGLDPRVGAWNNRVDTAADSLNNTDRRSMLQSLLSDFDKQSTERTSALMDLSGRKSAALGRVGSGMAAQDINQIARQALGDREVFRNQLAADTIDKEIGDRFGRASLFGNLGSQAYSQGADDRGFKYGVSSDNRNFRRGSKLDEANLAGSWFDRADTARRADRNEYRGERDYQDSREQVGIDRRLQQVQVEEALKSGDFNRALQLLQQGKTGSPAGAYAGAASDLSGQSGQTAQLLMQFLNSIGYNSGARG